MQTVLMGEKKKCREPLMPTAGGSFIARVRLGQTSKFRLEPLPWMIRRQFGKGGSRRGQCSPRVVALAAALPVARYDEQRIARKRAVGALVSARGVLEIGDRGGGGFAPLPRAQDPRRARLARKAEPSSLVGQFRESVIRTGEVPGGLGDESRTHQSLVLRFRATTGAWHPPAPQAVGRERC